VNLDKLNEIKDSRSTKASDVARQLGFAGIALVWVFKTAAQDTPVIPAELYLPGALIMVGLALDLLQYAVTTGALQYLFRKKERELRKKVSADNPGLDLEKRLKLVREKEFTIPYEVNWAASLFFWGKILAISSGYVFLVVFLLHRVRWSFA